MRKIGDVIPMPYKFIIIMAIAIVVSLANVSCFNNTARRESTSKSGEVSIPCEWSGMDNDFSADESFYSVISDSDTKTFPESYEKPKPYLTPKADKTPTSKPQITDKPPSVPTVTGIPLPAKKIHVKDFGAVGDGKTDDSGAVSKAIQKAVELTNRTVVFENKTYYMGANHLVWELFYVKDTENIVIDGNGATLLMSNYNVPFYVENVKGFSIMNMQFDYENPNFTQGTITSIEKTDNSFLVEIQQGYPHPPVDEVVFGKNLLQHGGGGRHGLIFKSSDYHRMESTMDHFYAGSITGTERDNVYRFKLESGYERLINEIETGMRITYGIAGVDIENRYLRNKVGWNTWLIRILRSSDVLLQDVNIYGTIAMGVNVADNYGKVTLLRTNIRLKPGSSHLVASTSDGFHIKNNRVGVSIIDCYLESTSDDLINISTMEDRVTQIISDRELIVQSTENAISSYTILEGDRLLFIDASSRKIGITEVKEVISRNRGNRSHRIVLEESLTELAPINNFSNSRILNLNQLNPGTVIRGNTFKPILRNALLTRFSDGIIENNVIESLGGRVGINMSGNPIENTRYSNIFIRNNVFNRTQLWGIYLAAGVIGKDGKAERAAIRINDNEISPVMGDGIAGNRVSGVEIIENIINMDQETHPGNLAIKFIESEYISISGGIIRDKRHNIQAVISIKTDKPESINIECVEILKNDNAEEFIILN